MALLSEEEMAEYEESSRNQLVPPEVVFEILKRLPLKSLCRFKCVSVLWYAIISDTGFASSHLLLRRSRPTVLAVLPQEPKSKDIWLHFHAHHGDGAAGTESLSRVLTDSERAPHFKVHADERGAMPMHVSRSVGGLVCLEYRDHFKICNPSTGQHVTYPSTRAQVQHPTDYGAQWTSLCFDPVMNQHKVLQSIVNLRLNVLEHRVMILFPTGELGDRGWRRIGDIPFSRVVIVRERDEVCLNGVVYYMARVSRVEPREVLGQYLMKFHVHQERFQLGSGNLDKRRSDPDKYQSKLVEYSNGQVAIVDCPKFNRSNHGGHIQMWVFNRVGVTRRLQPPVSIALPPEEMLPGRASQLSVLGSIHAGDVLVFMSTVGSESSCLFYDAKINSFTRRVQIHIPVLGGYPVYSPFIRQPSISDHEENLMVLEN